MAGWLSFSIVTVEAMYQVEDYLLLAALTDDSSILDHETAYRLLTLPGSLESSELLMPPDELELITRRARAATVRDISERNAQFFEVEVGKLEGWADDLKLGLEREIKDFDRQIKEARRAATVALSLEEKLAGQKRIKTLESQRGEKRRSLFEAQDKVDENRGNLIADIERRLTQKVATEHHFTIRWRLI